MTACAEFCDYPLTFPSHSRPLAPRFRIRRDCFAGLAGIAGIDDIPVLHSLPGDGLCVFAAPPPAFETIAALEPRAVYSFSADEPPAVPTGRVFVQGADEASVAPAVAALGYVIESVPPYAPHAAWIVAGDASIAAALSNLEALFELDAIVAVEPQMLRPVATR